MTPSENIYRSDYDEVDAILDGLIDVEDYSDDDGQPTMYEEYQDLYGGDDWDYGQFDTPEDFTF